VTIISYHHFNVFLVFRVIVGCSKPCASSMTKLSIQTHRPERKMASVPVWKSSKRWRMLYVPFDTAQGLHGGFEPGRSIFTRCVLVPESISRG
jgi:hypothetical protein